MGFLTRFWMHFGSQNGAQMDAKIDQKINEFSDGCLGRFGRIFGAKMESKNIPKTIKFLMKFRMIF